MPSDRLKDEDFIAAWKRAAHAAGQKVPPRAFIRPTYFAPFMSVMLIAEFDPDRGAMIPLYSGSDLNTLMGVDVTGCDPKDLLSEPWMMEAHAKMVEFLLGNMVGVGVSGSARSKLGLLTDYRQLRLPIMSDGIPGIISYFQIDHGDNATNVQLEQFVSIDDVSVHDIGFGAPDFPHDWSDYRTSKE